jgi:hypothetical protein
MAAKSTDSEKQLFAIQFGPDPALTGSIPKPRLDLKVQAIKTVVTCSVSLREKPSGSAKCRYGLVNLPPQAYYLFSLSQTANRFNLFEQNSFHIILVEFV